MEPTECPICHKKEWRHICGGAASSKPVAVSKARPKKKSKIVDARSDVAKSSAVIEELLARVESLESRVLELENRKKYMREYQRARRLKEKDDGNG